MLRAGPWLLAALLWAPIAIAGGLGFAPLIFLIMLGVLNQPKELAIRPYMVALGASVLFAAVSTSWSPLQPQLVEIDIANGKYAVKATALRVWLVFVVGGIVIGAAIRTPQNIARIAIWGFVFGFALQAASIVALSYFQDELVKETLFLTSRPEESHQNISRNANIMSFAAILFMALVKGGFFGGGALVRHCVVAFTAAFLAWHLFLVDNLASVVSCLLGWAAIYIIPLWGRYGIKALGVLSAGYVMSAPWFYAVFIHLVGDKKEMLPASAWQRIEIWSLTIEAIEKKLMFGWGLDAVRSFTGKFDEGAWEGFHKFPNHPHNNLLHVWLETGYVGAILISLAILLAAWRVPSRETVGNGAYSAVCGLWVAFLVVCSFSYSLWNEWWWSMVALCFAIAILISRSGTRESVALEGKRQ